MAKWNREKAILSASQEIKIKESHRQKDLRDFKNKIKLTITPERTYVIVYAWSDNSVKNGLQKILTDGGQPIGGCVIDDVNNCLYVNCMDYLMLGHIPVSYVMRVEGGGHWETRIPMPEPVIYRYLSDEQRYDLEKFKTICGSASFHFLQLISSE